MPARVSPGLYTNILDFSDYATRLGAAVFCVVGAASKGPINKPTRLTSAADATRQFGLPLLDDPALQTLIQFFQKGRTAVFCRVASPSALTADAPIPGTAGGVPATKASGTVSFSSSLNPADGDFVTLRTQAPTLSLARDSVGVAGNVAITTTGLNVQAAGLSGGDASHAATGSIRFKNGTNPSDGEIVVISDGVTPVTFEFDTTGQFATGSTTFTGQPSDTDQLVLNDGVNPAVTFEFDSNNSVVQTGTLRKVVIGASLSDTITNLVNAINAAPALAITAVKTSGTVASYTNDALGVAGNVAITETDAGGVMTNVGMSGGVDAVVTGGNVAVRIGADAYTTIGHFKDAINANAFNVSASDISGGTTFEFDSNATIRPGAIGVLIGGNASATLLNLIAAIASNLGGSFTVANTTTTVPQLTVTTKAAGADRNAPILKLGTNVVVTGLTGGADATVGSATNVMGIAAASPGTWGNSLQVELRATTTLGAPAGNFDMLVSAPIDESGTLGVVERFNNLSTADLVDPLTGLYDPAGVANPRFIETVLADGTSSENPSQYVRADVLSINGVPVVSPALPGAPIYYELGVSPGTVGSNGIDTLSSADYIGGLSGQQATGLRAVSNPESVEFNILAVPGVSHTDVINEVLRIASARSDCVALIDPPFGLTRDQVIDWHNGLSNVVANPPTQPLDNAFGGLYWAWQQVYDSYNKRNLWLPPSGFVAAAMAFTDETAAPWIASAGHVRGLVSSLKTEFSPEQADRDLLVGGQNRVNPIVDFAQGGPTIYGNRTLQRRETALVNMHVVRMLVYAQKVIATSVKYLVFDPNDSTTWAKFTGIVNPILAAIKAGRGLEEFRVICDSTTNPAELQRQHRMNGKILLKAVEAAEIIEVDFALFASGAEFQLPV